MADRWHRANVADKAQSCDFNGAGGIEARVELAIASIQRRGWQRVGGEFRGDGWIPEDLRETRWR
jgi:hypothetical protein